MATYEKQQPQLNGAYYGPPIPPQPPQPAYYGPPVPRRSGPRCLFCCLFKVVAFVVIALGTASLVLWLIFRPSSVKAYADSATLSRFDLATGPGGGGPRGRGGDLLQYNLTVDIRVRNPNRFGIHYEYAEAQASYDGERFGFDPVQPFYLDSKSDSKITATFGGSSAIDDGVERTYQREKREGFYSVKVRVYADLGFKVRVFNIRDYKSKISCTLRLPVPVPNANSTTTTTTRTRCDVDF